MTTYTALCAQLCAEREESGLRVVEVAHERRCLCGNEIVVLWALDWPPTDRRSWLCCPACDRAERMS